MHFSRRLFSPLRQKCGRMQPEIVRLDVYHTLHSNKWSPEVVQNYRILNIQDPGNFMVASCSTNDWTEKMQRLYSESQERFQIKTTRVFKNYLYAYKDLSTNVWYRVRVDETDLWSGTAIVHLIDEGSGMEVDVCDLFSLDKEFWGRRPNVVKAKLADLFPPQGLSAWPRASVEKFRELCKPSDSFCGVARHNDGENVSLLMYRNEGGGTISVQRTLVELGLAQGAKTNQGSKEYEDMSMKDFRPSKSFFPKLN